MTILLIMFLFLLTCLFSLIIITDSSNLVLLHGHLNKWCSKQNYVANNLKHWFGIIVLVYSVNNYAGLLLSIYYIHFNAHKHIA